MPTFYIEWRIDIEAEDALAAARKALTIQRDPSSIATVFYVYQQDTCTMERLDLTELGSDAANHLAE